MNRLSTHLMCLVALCAGAPLDAMADERTGDDAPPGSTPDFLSGEEYDWNWSNDTFND
jgi:hypothetical protein